MTETLRKVYLTNIFSSIISLNTRLAMFYKVQKDVFQHPAVNFIYFFSDFVLLIHRWWQGQF